ncbi:hemolysin [Methyloceanibacter superfactus]|uniref:Hemolysin n=1 Tax=Methyloceanibacter superfactus TaxID=1774969 RepID=A0A1E3VJK4_9HYPH|nr:TlyA family RNA methyltransferase [Methyloceanibacter superfactus]ODR93707.1 hemolysin [Methyloceanibacter superfactus]
MASYKKKRIDRRLVELGLAPTRARAADLVRRGCVTVAGEPATKPGALVAEDAALAVAPRRQLRLPRRSQLEAALEAFGLDPQGRVALDVGASTGGFTEVLLARGAAKVYAVDVGRDQLHASLRADPRVVSLEATDARSLDTEAIPEPVDVIVADVSFISVTQALPAALKRAAPDAWLVVLVKPQFEAGREAVGKGGIVRDEQDRARAVTRVRDFLANEGWTVLDAIQSPIEGGSGNVEFLIGARHGVPDGA